MGEKIIQHLTVSVSQVYISSGEFSMKHLEMERFLSETLYFVGRMYLVTSVELKCIFFLKVIQFGLKDFTSGFSFTDFRILSWP